MGNRRYRAILAVASLCVVASLVASGMPLLNGLGPDDSAMSDKGWWTKLPAALPQELPQVPSEPSAPKQGDPVAPGPGDPVDVPPGGPSPPVIGPDTPGTPPGPEPTRSSTEGLVVDGKCNVSQLKHLADLEGQQNFSTVTPYYLRDGLYACADAVAAKSVEETVATERVIEEADIVKLDGKLMYVLNPYRGLLIVDLSVPYAPRIIGRAPVRGDPVDMYMVDGTAYIVVTRSFNYWYSLYLMEGALALCDIPIDVGSQVIVVDVSASRSPTVTGAVNVVGFIKDSRRVGDVIYYVSNCYSWYRGGQQWPVDETCVISLDMGPRGGGAEIERVSFPGTSNYIHVSQRAMYVAQPNNDWKSPKTTITVVDISDPRGDISVHDSITIDGCVQNKYQLDWYNDMLRVVSHYRRPRQESELWVIDVADPDRIWTQGRLMIDDAGNLMATRFAGERAYTIHLPQRIDPLDVIDLSDPSNPELCAILEMPGWVTHMEVRGYKILALGVDNSNGAWNVAVSLFDVTNPYNPEMLSRVRLGGNHAQSNANWDPKALTVLDDEGLIVVPFQSYTSSDAWDWWYYNHYTYSAQLVEFDLERGTLKAAGEFEQVDCITRTRGYGDYVVATSTRFLQVAHVKDHDNPRVTASLELCQNVVECTPFEGWNAIITRHPTDDEAFLKTYRSTDTDLLEPLGTVSLGKNVLSWHWIGRRLVSMSSTPYNETLSIVVTRSVDLSRPDRPTVMGSSSFAIKRNTSYSRYWYYYDFDMVVMPFFYRSYYYHDVVPTNPVLVGDGALALANGGSIYIVDVSDGTRPRLAAVRQVSGYNVVDLRSHGRMLYVVGIEGAKEGSSSYSPYSRYFLLPFDLTDPRAAVARPAINVPGSPLGFSESGDRVYTRSNMVVLTWVNPNNQRTEYAYADVLSVVDIRDGTGTLVSAVQLYGNERVLIEGDTAYLVYTKSERYPLETPDKYGRLYNYKYYTYVIEMDLSSPDPLGTARGCTLIGRHYNVMVANGLLFLSGGTSEGVVVIDTRNPGPLLEVGLFLVRSTFTHVTVRGGLVYLSQGMYGLSVLGVGN